MNAEIATVYKAYNTARLRLAELSPCPQCCPPKRPCSPGEYICGSDILRCKECGGDGFLINWEDE